MCSKFFITQIEISFCLDRVYFAFVQYVISIAFFDEILHISTAADALRTLAELFFYTKMKLYNSVLLLGGSFCSILEYKPIQFSCPVSMYTIFFLQYSQTQRADSLMAVRETFGHFVYMKWNWARTHENMPQTQTTDARPYKLNDCARIKKFLSSSSLKMIFLYGGDLYFFLSFHRFQRLNLIQTEFLSFIFFSYFFGREIEKDSKNQKK